MKQLIFGLAAPFALAACGTPPCTQCPDLEGSWAFVAAPTDVGASSCKHYFSSGFTEHLDLRQDGAQVISDDPPISGTLHESGQITFSPLPGHTSDGFKSTFDITGRFLQKDGVWMFKGSMYSRIFSNPTCTLTIATTGTRE